MIVTLTANPSLDRTIALEAALAVGEVQSAASERVDAAGKGVNVARVIAAAGAPVRAVLPLGPSDPYAVALRATGLDARPVPIAGRVRANLTITDPDGATTKLNLPGPELGAAEAEALIEAVVAEASTASWLVLAGSLPPGAGDDFYVRVARAVRAATGEKGPRIAVDTSGAPLRAVVDAGVADLIKPNDEELADLVGTRFATPDTLIPDVVAAAAALVPAKVTEALVTLGSDGGVLVTSDGAWRATPPRIDVASTVGAGDSSLAGYLLAAVADAAPGERLRRAVRYGAAAASLPGTQPPAPADLPAGDIPVAPAH